MPRSSVRAVLFDAVGTLIHPDPAVACVYRAAGLRYGIRLDEQQVARRFQAAYARCFAAQTTDEAHEQHCWRSVVAEVYRVRGPAAEGLFHDLWHHFADSRNWAVYPDVEAACRRLQQLPLQLAVASNFDARLIGICRERPVLAGMETVFCSSRIGYAKPRREFFDHIARHLGLSPREMLLVGDDRVRDYAGARTAGWQAIHLARGQGPCAADSIGSLDEVARWLGAR